MRVALYARVSTSDQKCESQLSQLYDWCNRHSWTVHETYVDVASGSRTDRAELGRLMEDARQKKFAAVLVWKLDRFGRSVINLQENLQKLKLWNVRFLAISQAIDTGENTATANLLLNMLAAIAEFERELIRERVRSGMDNARKKGVVLGRRRRIIDKYAVQKLRDEGLSWSAIAKRLGVGLGTAFRSLSKAG